MFKNSVKSLVVAAVVLFAQSAFADTIIKVGLGATGPDVQLAAGVFGTIDDAVAGTTGQQDTNVEFTGFLGVLPAILAGASFTLADVALVGSAVVDFGLGTVAQGTSGGTFNIYDAANSLLLSGSLGSGAISGSLATDVGSFFNTTIATFTGGSLLAFVNTTPAGLSFSLTDILSEGIGSALGVTVGCQVGCSLANFTADATGNISGVEVPEPATMTLLLGGLLAGARLRSRKTEV